MEFQDIEVMCGDHSGGINKDAACSEDAVKTSGANSQSTATDDDSSAVNQVVEAMGVQLAIAEIIEHTC